MKKTHLAPENLDEMGDEIPLTQMVEKIFPKKTPNKNTLVIQSPNLRMVMEPKYYAFRFGDEGHPLLII